MPFLVLSLLIAQATQGGAPAHPPSGPGLWAQFLIPLAIIFLVMYWLVLRPEQKRQKEHQAMLGNLKKNDAVLTSGGIYGTIHQIKDKEIIVKVDDNVKLRMSRSSIVSVLQTKETSPGD